MDTFIEISLIIVIAMLVSALMRLLKQPLIIGYILTGLVVGPYVLNIMQSAEVLQTFSEFGIALLLFIVGLHLSPKVIREVGKASVVVGVGQVVFTTIVGFGIAKLLGFANVEAGYIAIGLTFSSTIIILKLLYDKGDLEKLYGKITIGFLLVQDIIATAILVVMAASSQGDSPTGIAIAMITKGTFLAVFLYLGYKYVLPSLTKFFAKSQEFLFLFAIAWGMGLASLFAVMGFSLEIGALIAGVVLSMFPYNHEISSKMRPLRDFFLILFFILLGSQIALDSLAHYIVPAIIFSLFILIGNPLIVIILMGILGFNKKISFFAGLTVAQISEFSLILIAFAIKLGHIEEGIISLMTMVGLITITGSTYMILYAEKIYPKIAKYLTIFERKKAKHHESPEKHYDVIMFGANRIGHDFLNILNKSKSKYMIVDYDPHVIEELTKKQIANAYGDADDGEFLDDLPLDMSKMIISTIPDAETNLFIIEHIRRTNPDVIILVVAHTLEMAYELYNAGANYVIMPHFLGGRHASNLVHQYGFDPDLYNREKEIHIKELDERSELGH